VNLSLVDCGLEADQKLFKMDLQMEEEELISSDLGEVLVNMVYNDNLNRLGVTVIEAKRLKVNYYFFLHMRNVNS